MSYESKLSGARAILEAHNSKSTNPVDADKFFTNLSEMGGSSEDALSAASWEDLEACGAPRILARQIGKLFRGDQPQEGQGVQKVIIEDRDPEKLAKAMTPAQLIDAYDQKFPKSPVAERLKFFSEGKKCIVFNDDGTVNKEISLRLLNELDDHGEMPAFVTTSGEVRQVYRVGEKPVQAVQEHPLYPKTALRNGVSECGCDWNSIDIAIQQTLYLAVTKTGEINMEDYKEWDIFEIAAGGVAKVNRRYIQAAKLFSELKALGDLPSLRVKVVKMTKDEYKTFQANNPFNLGKNRSV